MNSKVFDKVSFVTEVVGEADVGQIGNLERAFEVFGKKLQSNIQNEGGQLVGLLNSLTVNPSDNLETEKWNKEIKRVCEKYGWFILGGDLSTGDKFQLVTSAVLTKEEK